MHVFPDLGMYVYPELKVFVNGLPCIDVDGKLTVIYGYTFDIVIYFRAPETLPDPRNPLLFRNVEYRVHAILYDEKGEIVNSCYSPVKIDRGTIVRVCEVEADLKNLFKPGYYSAVWWHMDGKYRLKIKVYERLPGQPPTLLHDLPELELRFRSYRAAAPHLDGDQLQGNFILLYKFNFFEGKWELVDVETKCIDVEKSRAKISAEKHVELSKCVAIVDISVPEQVNVGDEAKLALKIKNNCDCVVYVLVTPIIDGKTHVGKIVELFPDQTKNVEFKVAVTKDLKVKFKVFAKAIDEDTYKLIYVSDEYVVKAIGKPKVEPTKCKLIFVDQDGNPVGGFYAYMVKVGREIKSQLDVLKIYVPESGVVEFTLPEPGNYYVEVLKKTTREVILYANVAKDREGKLIEFRNGSTYRITVFRGDRSKIKAIPISYEFEFRGITASVIANLLGIPIVGGLTRELLERFFHFFIAPKIIEEFRRRHLAEIIHYNVSLINVDPSRGVIRFKVSILADPVPLTVIIGIILAVAALIAAIAYLVNAYTELRYREEVERARKEVVNQLNELLRLCREGHTWACELYNKVIDVYREFIEETYKPPVKPAWLQTLETVMRYLPFIIAAFIVIELIRALR